MIPIVAALLLTAGAIALDGWLLRFDPVADVLTPSPARVVQSFVGAINARRPASAVRQLTEVARGSATTDRLAADVAEAHARHGTLRWEDATAAVDGAHAEVVARLASPTSGFTQARFTMRRDLRSRLWGIAAHDLVR